MIEWIIYLVGVVIVFAFAYSGWKRDGKITLGEAIFSFVMCLLSWGTIIILFLIAIIYGLDSLLASEKVIYHMKGKEKDSDKSTDEDVPVQSCSFSVGDRIRLKGNTGDHTGFCIVDIREGIYWCDAGITIPCSQQNKFEKFQE